MKMIRLRKYKFRQQRRRVRRHGVYRRGFTLTELMIASLLTAVVILLAWTGLLSAINMSNKAQAITSRKLELTTALDVITQEVRQAQLINQSGNVISNGNDVSLEDVITQSGLNVDEIGNTGDLALYLEIPTNTNIKSCMTDKGPVPADTMDRVVYDVRESPVAWLPPEVVARYGRIPDIDGSINPCSQPVANDIIADSIAQTNTQPDCDGVLSGGNGFHVCQQGGHVDLLFESAISDVSAIPMQSSVTTRAITFIPSDPPADSSDWSLELEVKPAPGKAVKIEWEWAGGAPDEQPPSIDSYHLKSTVTNSGDSWWSESTSITMLHETHSPELKYSLSDNTSPGDVICFSLKAMSFSDADPIISNQVCHSVK